MSSIRFGTCSWKYESWKGIIYPESGRFNYLKEYSKHFDTVEIDQWFWSLFETNKIVLPKLKDVNDYSSSVSDEFLFTIKVPNSLTLTHYYRKNKKDVLKQNPYFLSIDLFKEFLSSIKPIITKTGCLIFQFEYLNKEKMKSQIEFEKRFEEFFEQISSNKIPIGIEIRNPNYLNKKFFNFIGRNKIIPVFLQGYYMPDINKTIRDLGKDIIGSVVIRLHGPDRSGIEKISGENWNKIYINRQQEIDSLSSLFNDLLSREIDLFINVNNHFEGSAPLTIDRIKKTMKII